MVNADMIRRMSNEDLAKFLACPAEIDKKFKKPENCWFEDCALCTLEWLQQEFDLGIPKDAYTQLSKAISASVDATIKELQRGIPKKPIFIFNSSDTDSCYCCPTCADRFYVHHDSGVLNGAEKPFYCKKCGQAFDWSKGE